MDESLLSVREKTQTLVGVMPGLDSLSEPSERCDSLERSLRKAVAFLTDGL